MSMVAIPQRNYDQNEVGGESNSLSLPWLVASDLRFTYVHAKPFSAD